MFSENLTKLRKSKGLSQEELAQRLHVVRQTVSKWEKGLSVPDANLLIELAEIFEIPVGTLLGSPVLAPENQDIIGQKLEQLNLLLAERNKRSRIIWRVVVGVLLFFVVATIVVLILSMTFQFVPTTTSLSPAQEQAIHQFVAATLENPTDYTITVHA